MAVDPVSLLGAAASAPSTTTAESDAAGKRDTITGVQGSDVIFAGASANSQGTGNANATGGTGINPWLVAGGIAALVFVILAGQK